MGMFVGPSTVDAERGRTSSGRSPAVRMSYLRSRRKQHVEEIKKSNGGMGPKKKAATDSMLLFFCFTYICRPTQTLKRCQWNIILECLFGMAIHYFVGDNVVYSSSSSMDDFLPKYVSRV